MPGSRILSRHGGMCQSAGTHTGTFVISGRMADVCAERHRLAA